MCSCIGKKKYQNLRNMFLLGLRKLTAETRKRRYTNVPNTLNVSRTMSTFLGGRVSGFAHI